MIRIIVFSTVLLLFFGSLIADGRHQQIQGMGYEYLSPLPGSRSVSPQSQIMLRFQHVAPEKLHNLDSFLSIKGSESDHHTGYTKIASDERTVIFVPDKPFIPGETVTVSLRPSFSVSTIVSGFAYSFEVSATQFNQPVAFPDEQDRGDGIAGSKLFKKHAAGWSEAEIPTIRGQARLATGQARLSGRSILTDLATGQARIMSNGVSVPATFPEIDITVNNNPDSGLIFINDRDYPRYQLILENSGDPVWYWQVPDDRRDFKAQSNGQLSMMIRDGYGGNGDGYIVLDEHYEYVKTIRGSNGYWLDEHELVMMPDSGYFIIGRREERRDMSAYGKPSDAIVRETCIQEYTKDDELIFQWAAWDYFDPADLDYEVNGNDNYIRFPHMNAVFVDEDGHILLSSRHLSEVTKIHRQTGEIIWRLSGKKNQFTFINDDLNGFRNQHAVRFTGTNRYTVFDNGNSHSPPQSRAVEYQLDTLNMTATLVWEFKNDRPQYYSYYMGNAQRLPNGNTLINWAIGELPKLSEITPDGEKAYEMTFADGTHVYRTFRKNWKGERKTPYLIVESYSTHVDLIFNKFGDPDVDYYNIYAGNSPNPVMLLDTSKTTLKTFNDLESGYYYFRVTAVDKDGTESWFSNEEGISVNIITPGSNMVRNGDFENGANDWIWETSGSASAQWSVVNGRAQIAISSGGDDIFNVQLRQAGIPLVQGREYVLEFDAWAENQRLAEIKVGQDSGPWINYSKIGYSVLEKQSQRFEYPFTMEDPSDFNARMVINCGTNNNDVYIDNIVVKEVVQTGLDQDQKFVNEFKLNANYPNPFNPSTTISFRIPESGFTTLRVYNVLGKEVASLVSKQLSPGVYRYAFDGQHLSSGVYYYQLVSGDFRETRKMILLR